MRPTASQLVCLVILSISRPGPTQAEPFEFFVLGDTRSNPEVLEENVRSMATLNPRAIACFNGGDVTSSGERDEWADHNRALADGAPDDAVPEDPTGIIRQSLFRTDAGDWGDYIRYLAAFGNHDDGSDDWLENWNDYLPGQKNLGANGDSGVYFALTYDRSLFVVLDSVHTSDEQTEWLRHTLAASESQEIDWRFVFFHHPVYPCNDKSPFDEGLEWVELLETYNVDIAFVAHSHTYERTCPMRGGNCSDDGVVYLNSSAGAASARSVDDSRAETVEFGDRSDEYDCTQILARGRGDWQHFCHVAVAGCTATVDCYAHDYWDGELTPHDTLIIDKIDCQEPDDSDPIGGADAGVPDVGDAGVPNSGDAGADTDPDQGGHADWTNATLTGGCSGARTNDSLTAALIIFTLIFIALSPPRRKTRRRSDRPGS